MGSEEFLAVISNPSAEQLHQVAERCPAAGDAVRSGGGFPKRAGYRVDRRHHGADGDTAASLVERVDRLMYRAKAGAEPGRV